MMEKEKIDVVIGGLPYTLVSDDTPEYIAGIAADVDAKITTLLRDYPRISTTQAAVLAALDFCDERRKSAGSSDNLRAQIKDYLEDSNRLRQEVDEARREIDRLKHELTALRMRVAGNG